MNMSRYRATFAVISGLAMLSPATSSLAQQQTAPAAQQAPALSQVPAIPAQAAPPPQAPAPSAAAQSAPAPAAAAPVASDASAAPADGGRLLKSTAVALRELSPWSMFLSADVPSFAEIVRAEARRVRLGMGVLATIGATSPFVGLFGTVWGIMNSFIGISKSQTTNLAVVAPGIAEALLATALGLVAAIPAVIIYNHFARVTKGYLELVGRASGAAGRLLSRDLDRTHGATHSRAAE